MTKYRDSLYRELQALNEDFLSQSEYQFAEYLGLSVIQILFNQNLGDPTFIAIFARKDKKSVALGTELLKSQTYVEEEVAKFRVDHAGN